MDERRVADLTPIEWTLGDLARTRGPAHTEPDDAAYAAVSHLLLEPFMRSSARQRERQIHSLHPCFEGCELCPAIGLRYVQWATVKLHKGLRQGPPRTRQGEVVRDWQTILAAVTDPVLRGTRLAQIRRGLLAHVPADDPLLPLIHAFGTQFAVRGQAKGPRLMKDIVNDMKVSVLSQQQGWAAKPRRDLTKREDLVAASSPYPAGTLLLDDVLKRLEFGVIEAFEQAFAREDCTPAATGELRALISALLARESTREWYLTNFEGRYNYNIEAERRTIHRSAGDEADPGQ